MRLLSATLLLSVAALSAPAVAADLGIYPQIPPSSDHFSWTGFYAGVYAGYGASSIDGTVIENPISDGADGRTDILQIYADQSAPFAISLSDSGTLLGVLAGYNHQVDNIVGGLEVDLSFSDLDHLVEDEFYGFTEDKLQFMGSVRGRVGIAVDRMLPYVTGGLAFGQVEATYTEDEPDSPIYTATSNHFGWTLGAGIDYAVTDNLFVRGEVRYTDFLNAYNANWESDINPKLTEVRVGINLKQ